MGKPVSTRRRVKPGHRPAARSVSIPRFVPPQLATLVDSPPPGDGWRHEIKYDGYRIEGLIGSDTVRLVTRNGNDWTDRFPAVARALGRLPPGIVDGEVVAFDPRGRSSFQQLQQGIGVPDSPVVFVVFDLLQAGNDDLRDLPLVDRSKRLARWIAPLRGNARAVVRLSEELPGPGPRALAAACKHGLEGIIAKRLDAPYRSGRVKTWLKVKCGRRQELIVLGYTPPRGSRVALGSLLLGVMDKRRLRYAGRVGTGMPTALLHDLLRRLAPLARKTSPLDEKPARLPAEVRWVEPRLVVEVAFTEWTADGRLRHPTLIALREDKRPDQVRREQP